MARRHDDRLGVRRPGAGRPRKRPRESDKPVAEEILGEATRLFARHGINATTMADVAAASGLQVSSLYYYFRSKHEMLERIVADVNRIPLEAMARATADHADASVRLHAFVRADAAALCQFPFDINEIHRLAGDEEEIFGRYWRERQQLNDAVEEVVQRGIDTGRFRAVDAHLAALTILANDEAAQNWYRPVGSRRLATRTGEPREYTPAEVGTFLADTALRGLLDDPSQLADIRSLTGPA